MTSKEALLVRRGLLRPPCHCEFCSSNVDDFIPTPEGLNKILPEESKKPFYDRMTIKDMRVAHDFLFAPDEFQKVNSARRLQNEHVYDLAKKYYQPRKS